MIAKTFFSKKQTAYYEHSWWIERRWRKKKQTTKETFRHQLHGPILFPLSTSGALFELGLLSEQIIPLQNKPTISNNDALGIDGSGRHVDSLQQTQWATQQTLTFYRNHKGATSTLHALHGSCRASLGDINASGSEGNSGTESQKQDAHFQQGSAFRGNVCLVGIKSVQAPQESNPLETGVILVFFWIHMDKPPKIKLFPHVITEVKYTVSTESKTKGIDSPKPVWASFLLTRPLSRFERLILFLISFLDINCSFLLYLLF